MGCVKHAMPMVHATDAMAQENACCVLWVSDWTKPKIDASLVMTQVMAVRNVMSKSVRHAKTVIIWTKDNVNYASEL
jgi:hypothetical protein